MRAASFGEGTGARAEVTLLWGQRAVLRAARGSRGECAVATVRTGVAWSSFACWLVILIRAGSSEVGARSPGADLGIALVCMSSLTCAHKVTGGQPAWGRAERTLGQLSAVAVARVADTWDEVRQGGRASARQAPRRQASGSKP